MVSMPVPKDIRSFQPKFIGPFTKRQFMALLPASIIAAIAIGVGSKFIPGDFLYVILAAIDIPIVACGFIDIQGVPLKTFFKEAILTKATYPHTRFYKTENIYDIYAKQNTISYAYFDGDATEYKGRDLIKKQKEDQKRLMKFYELNPDLKPLDIKRKNKEL